MFGPVDPRLNAMRAMPAWQMSGPVPDIQLTPGFRPPGAGGGGMPQAPQAPQLGMPQIPFIPGLGRWPAGPNEQKVNKVNDEAGTSDPMAQGAAQVADAQGGGFGAWLKRNIGGLF